ncbi:hypothetical protein ACH5RR_002239 [Cinchona calisaya]|uniref:Uncharacterized protein n=1 Tax=Cinchona calisaya TaxID=153742 RepID=A0ABD3B6C2_9GENT
MAESNWPETAPESANLVMPELCSYELARSNSDVASSLTAEISGDILHPSANATPDTCMAWTDEKHNKYLDSLEASFVQQLQQPRSFLAWRTEQNRSDKDISKKQQPVSVNKSSEQFAVLQDGRWQKRIFKNNQSLSYISTFNIQRMHSQRRAGKETSLLSADPKDCNQFQYEKEYLVRKRALCNRPASSSDQKAVNRCYHNSDSIDKDSAEGSGQNFVDEDCEHDPNGISLAKRLKTAVGDISSKEQIVPSGKFSSLGKSIISTSTFEGQANHEDSSKDFVNWSIHQLM